MSLDLDSLKAAKFIAALGGPTLNENDIEATHNLEGGKILLDWLAKQVLIGPKEIKDQEECLDGQVNAALQDVALEKEEFLILKQVSGTVSAASAEDNDITLEGYLPPSRQKKHAEYIGRENDMVQREIDLLKARVSKTKEAFQKLTQSVKLLQSVVYDLDLKTRKFQGRILDLSFNADTTVSLTTKEARELLADLGQLQRTNDTAEKWYTKPGSILKDGTSDMDIARTFLLHTKNGISRITHNLRENIEALSIIQQNDSGKVLELQRETSRLQNALHSESDKRNQLGEYDKELLRICESLERASSLEAADRDGMLRELLSELDESREEAVLVDAADLDVGRVLRSAWAKDQAATLKMEAAILDEGLRSLAIALDPLENLYSSMSSLSSCLQEAEVLIEAFGEELEDIQVGEKRNARQVTNEDNDVETELRRVLAENQDLRPRDASPLVLLSREDILTELSDLKAQLVSTETSEKCLVERLVQEYSSRPLHPALAQIYSNSTLNDSPAFAFPARVQELESLTKKKAAELQSLASSLEEEVRETFSKGHFGKRLDAFMERWTGE